MPIARVQLPDGRIGKFEVPDGTTPEQVEAFARNSMAVGGGVNEGIQPPAEDVQAPQTSNPGFIDRVSKDYDNRLGNMQKSADELVSGNQTGAETNYQFAGQTGLLLNDIAGEAFKSAGNGLSSVTPDFIENPIKQAGRNVFDYVANSPVGNMASSALQKYAEFTKDNPRASRNIDATLGLGSVVGAATPIKGTSAIGAAVDASRSSGKFLKDVGKDIVSAPDGLPAVNQSAKEAIQSKPYYQVFDEIGGGLPQDQVKSISKKINSIRPTDVAEAALWDESGAQGTIDLFNKATSQGNLTFRGAQALRADVNSRIKKAYRADEDTLAGNLMKVKEQLTEALTKTDASDISDVKTKNAWKMANHEFAKESLLDDLDMIAAKATSPSRAQPANSLATAIDGFLNNPKLSRGLLENERKALEEVSKSTSTGELLKSGATRLIPAALAAKAGPVGFIIGHYGSQIGRDAALASRIKKLDRAYEIIKNRKTPEISEYKPPLMITDQRRGTLERNISKRKSYEESKSQSGPSIPMGEKKQLALPSPQMKTPSGVGLKNRSASPATDSQIKIYQKIMETTDKPLSNELSSVVKTPVSQYLKMQDSLKGIKKHQLNNMKEKLLRGDLSQNKFTDNAAKNFGLSPSQARSLAREITKYNGK